MDQINFLEMMSLLELELDSVWPTGRNTVCLPQDGRHFNIPGHPRPVSIGRVEALLLHNLAKLIRAERGFEIGTAFGYSSFWLGAGIAANAADSGWLGSLDNYQEGGIGPIGQAFAQTWSERLGLSNTIQYLIGRSPEDVGLFVKGPIDIAFIDGNHHGDQPRQDYFAVRPFFSRDALLVWHDIEPKYDVNLGVAEAIKDGWSIITFPTSCRIGVCYRTLAGWNVANEAFNIAARLELA